MATTNQVREVHKLLDSLFDNSELSHAQIDLIRGLVPELPKQKTLEEISWDVHFAWCETSGNDWKEELFGDLETWLSEQHNQLRAHLEGVKSQAHPALPAGMRLAEHKNYGCVVATDWIDSDNKHFCVYYSDVLERGSYVFLPEDSLTFIDSKPAHPKFLETEADYTDVPEGTILARDGLDTAWVKKFDGWVSTETSRERTSKELGYVRRRVLRWGWGN